MTEGSARNVELLHPRRIYRNAVNIVYCTGYACILILHCVNISFGIFLGMVKYRIVSLVV